MSEETVINCCSPCLAGLKTGNLFSCKVDDKNDLLRSVRELNRRLVPRGLRIMPVKITKTRALIYLYRPDRLEKDLADKTAAELLSERAYPVGCTESTAQKIQNASALGRFTVTKRRHRKNSSFIKNAQECIKTLTKSTIHLNALL